MSKVHGRVKSVRTAEPIPSAVVLDASFMLAVLLPDEESVELGSALAAWCDQELKLLVPSHWWIEVTNTLVVSLRRGRISREVLPSLGLLLQNLPLETHNDSASAAGALDLTAFAELTQLSSYDAAYLRLARDNGAMLATLDRDLRRAAQQLGTAVYPGTVK